MAQTGSGLKVKFEMTIKNIRRLSGILIGLSVLVAGALSAQAAEDLPWGQSQPPKVITPESGPDVDQRQGGGGYGGTGGPANRQTNNGYQTEPYSQNGAGNQNQNDNYYDQTPQNGQYGQRPGGYSNGNGSGQYDRGGAYGQNQQPYAGPPPRPGPYAEQHPGGYSSDEIVAAGRSFFGTVSGGLASVIEYAFQKQGRPNGYILGEEAGGAFVAGLRYGEGTLHTRDAGQHKVYWQGPSIGYDFGAEGSKTMILVYNLSYPDQIYKRFTGVDGSAYLVGGVGITFQKRGNVVLAPIRSGVGVRLGANIGYLKYSRYPTWNPF